MTIFEMLEQSAVLTVLGMTVVFAFLWVMIVCVNLAAKLIHKAGLDKDVRPEKKESGKWGGTAGTSGKASPEKRAEAS
jgi:oxaloacetate decarboxylase gamma subunit